MTAIELLRDPDPALTALAHDLEAARAESYPLTFEVARLAVDSIKQPWPVLDALTTDLGFAALGENWIEIPRRMANKLLTQLIAGELAYPFEVIDAERAGVLAGRFLDLFPTGTRYFTNGAVSGEFAVYDTAGNEVVGWRSLSDAIFDNGVIAIGGERVGLIWAEDSP